MKNKIIGTILLFLAMAGCFKLDRDEKLKEENQLKKELNEKDIYLNRGKSKYNSGDYKRALENLIRQ